MQNPHFKHLLTLNFAMLCISTSGALGRYIQLPPPVTIWYRAVFALSFLGIFCIWKGYTFRFDSKKDAGILFLTGILMMTHWVTYFFALQWANVAIAMLSLFTYPILTTLLEPFFFKTKFQRSHLIYGGMILIGIYFIAPSFDLDNKVTQGLLMGLLSGISYAIRNLILKAKIEHFNGSILMFYQMLVMVLVLFPVLWFYPSQSVESALPYIVFLGLVTTSIGHTLFLSSFRHFSISTASIMSSMQPVFGILIAAIFLHEIPAIRSLIGGGLILLTVVLASRKG